MNSHTDIARGRKFLKRLTRLDILTVQDAIYVPVAESLLAKLQKQSVKRGLTVFRRHYRFPGVEIFVSGSPFENFIRVRTGGPPGEYLVLPVIRKISTDTTTTGAPCFLNGRLTVATEATEYPDLAAITSRVSKFPHKTSSKRYTGVLDSSPDRRGYFKKRIMETAGAASLLNYAGVFKHSYIDPITEDAAVEFLHAAARESSPDISEGLFFHTPALGDQLVAFQTLPNARRPAVHVSMFVSPDGKKIVAEEQFLLAALHGFPEWFILRSIIDVDLGNAGDPVILSDFENLGAYSASDFETGGSGTVTDINESSTTDLGGGDFEINESDTRTGEVSYPVSTAIKAGGSLISTTVDTNFAAEEVFFQNTADGLINGTHVETISRYIRNSPLMNISVPTRVRNQIGGTAPGPVYDPAPVKFSMNGTLKIWYSSASLPAVIFTYDEETIDYVFVGPTEDDEDGAATTRNFTRRVTFSVGALDRILSEEISGPAMSNDSVAVPDTEDLHAYGYSPTFPDLIITHAEPGTILVSLPDVVDKPNREWVGDRVVTDDIQFASHSRKSYVGSIFVPYLPNDITKKRFTFSHSDAAMKKTIVNYVLGLTDPEDLLDGAALDDYEIWFTAIRAI